MWNQKNRHPKCMGKDQKRKQITQIFSENPDIEHKKSWRQNDGKQKIINCNIPVFSELNIFFLSLIQKFLSNYKSSSLRESFFEIYFIVFRSQQKLPKVCKLFYQLCGWNCFWTNDLSISIFCRSKSLWNLMIWAFLFVHIC